MPSYPSLWGPEEIGQKTFGGNLDGCLTPRVSWEPIFALAGLADLFCRKLKNFPFRGFPFRGHPLGV